MYYKFKLNSMSQFTTVGDIEIEHEGDVSNGIEYIRNNWGSSELERILATTKDYSDHMCHFEHNGNNYILIRKESGKYFLEPN